VICVSRFLLRLGCAFSGISVVSTAATAQLEPEAHLGTRIPTRPETFKQDRTEQVLAEYASCVVKKQRVLASQFVLDRTTLQFEKKYRALGDGNCLVEATGTYFAEVGLSLSGDTMRFALAEALLRDEIGGIDPARLSQAAELQIPLLSNADYEPKSGRQYRSDELKALDENRQRDQTTLIKYRFGDCAVRSNPQGARVLLQTAANSGAEAAAIQAIMPALGGCLEKGAQIKLNRSVLRGALAFSYYSLAHARAATQPAAPTTQQ
jgi:hypothetical protein